MAGHCKLAVCESKPRREIVNRTVNTAAERWTRVVEMGGTKPE